VITGCRAFVWLLWAAALAGGATLAAQQPESGGRFKFRSRAELINVTATVTDRSERFVPGLQKEDFRLFEDGAAQTITHFSDERVPVSLGLVVDMSGSMEGEKWSAARTAIDRFLNELLSSDDEVFLMAFSDRVDVVEEWTQDRARVSRAMGRIRPRGGTAMYDAVAEAIPMAQSGTRRKKALLVISDGNDRNSETAIGSLRQAIRQTEVLIYAVGIDGESEAPFWTRRPSPGPPRVPFPIPIPGRRPPVNWPGQPQPQTGRTRGSAVGDERVNEAALREMTDDSGGRTEIVRSARDLGPATASIADELSQQYFLGYPPAAKKDGQWHTIRVEVRNRDYLVRARRGYVATP
jgi:Ca-activated chloride channel family protein